MPGACCIPVGENIFVCRDFDTKSQCDNLAGIFYEHRECVFADCLTGRSKGACCLPDAECEILEHFDCLGRVNFGYFDQTHCAEINCGGEPPDPPEECRDAGPDRIPAGRQPWDTNLCQNAMFDPTVRPVEHNPDSTGDERGNDDFAPGDFELMTAHPVRAMPTRADDDPCVSHYGMVMVAPDGTHRGVFCSQPMADRTDQRQATEMDVYTQVAPDPLAIMRPGDSFFAGAYHAPWFTEVQYRSFEVNCSDPT